MTWVPTTDEQPALLLTGSLDETAWVWSPDELTSVATNKFATMLHRNTHKITVILVYAVLEWILIFLLLLNPLFSFLISKFAHYFGLKPPCLWCSRVDHMLDPNTSKRNSYRNLVCEAHATEISKLGYCPNHKKLADHPQNLCKDCLSTHPKHAENSIEISRRIGFFTWVSENRLENGDKINSKCSCCDQSLSNSKWCSQSNGPDSPRQSHA